MITFVGAGPGAPDLITLRGQRAIAAADLIIYAGSLVNPALLEYRTEGCAVLDSAGMTLEEVVQAMAEAHAKNQRVVRLHTGDPSLYGAIREQMERLEALGIPYDIVPGVSSFLGAAAALKAELTVPGISQTVILTRMPGRTPVPEKEDIAGLAAHRASMAIFLSAAMLEELAAKLIRGGYAASTPAAIVHKATWADERIVRTSLEHLARAAREHGIAKTAMVLVGDFLGPEAERSRLYDPSFSHGYRDSNR